MSEPRIKATLSPAQIDAAPRCGVEATAYAKSYAATDAAHYVALGGCDISAVAMARAGAHAITSLDSVYVEIAVFPAGCIPTIWDDGDTLWDVPRWPDTFEQTGNLVFLSTTSPILAALGDNYVLHISVGASNPHIYRWEYPDFVLKNTGVELNYGTFNYMCSVGVIDSPYFKPLRNVAIVTYDVTYASRIRRFGLDYYDRLQQIGEYSDSLRGNERHYAITGFSQSPYLSDRVATLTIYGAYVENNLRMYDWNAGLQKYILQSATILDIPLSTDANMQNLTDDVIVLGTSVAGGLRFYVFKYDFDLSSFSQIGPHFEFPGESSGRMVRLDDSHVAAWLGTSDTLRVLRFDEETLTEVPLADYFSLSCVDVSMAEFGPEQFAFADSSTDRLRMLAVNYAEDVSQQTLWDGYDGV
jgi:hypothetical protein